MGRKNLFRPIFVFMRYRPRKLFLRMFVRRLRVLVGLFAVFERYLRVRFSLVVLALGVMVRRLTVVVCCRLVMTCRVVMVFVCWMLLSHVCFSFCFSELSSQETTFQFREICKTRAYEISERHTLYIR